MKGLKNSIKEFRRSSGKYRKLLNDCQQESDSDWFDTEWLGE